MYIGSTSNLHHVKTMLEVVHITITWSWRHHVSNYIPVKFNKFHFSMQWISLNSTAMMFIFGHLINQDWGNICKVNVKIVCLLLPVVPEGQCLPLLFFFKLPFPGQNPNFLALDQLQMFLIFRQTLHVFKPARVTSTIKGRVTVTSSSVTWRHLKRCSFQRFIST